MANEFVRKIRKTDVKKEPLATNTEGDILLDKEKGPYIHYNEKYLPIGEISNLTFNTDKVKLVNTAKDSTKRIELSEDLLEKINAPIRETMSVNSVNKEYTFHLKDNSLYFVACIGTLGYGVLLGLISTYEGQIQMQHLVNDLITVNSDGLNLTIKPNNNQYTRMYIEKLN